MVGWNSCNPAIDSDTPAEVCRLGGNDGAPFGRPCVTADFSDPAREVDEHSGVLLLGQWQIGEVGQHATREPSNRCAAAIAQVQLERRLALSSVRKLAEHKPEVLWVVGHHDLAPVIWFAGPPSASVTCWPFCRLPTFTPRMPLVGSGTSLWAMLKISASPPTTVAIFGCSGAWAGAGAGFGARGVPNTTATLLVSMTSSLAMPTPNSVSEQFLMLSLPLPFMRLVASAVGSPEAMEPSAAPL